MSRRVVAAASVVAVFLVVGGVAMYAVSEEGDPGPTPTEEYMACVAAAGADLGGFAEAVYDQDGVLIWMKTGVDVPVEVHSPCLKSVGGTGVSLNTSSYGY